MKSKKFKFNVFFTKVDIKNYPQGWIYKSQLHHHVRKKIQNGRTADLSKQIIFIKPDIWGEAELRTEYWKEETDRKSTRLNSSHRT